MLNLEIIELLSHGISDLEGLFAVEETDQSGESLARRHMASDWRGQDQTPSKSVSQLYKER